jgi:hypothetical protein
MAKEPVEFTRDVDIRFIPAGLFQARWFALTDWSALAIGDWIYNPCGTYAGVVTEIDGAVITTKDHRRQGETPETSYIIKGQRPGRQKDFYLWADPVLQHYDIPSGCSCGCMT